MNPDRDGDKHWLQESERKRRRRKKNNQTTTFAFYSWLWSHRFVYIIRGARERYTHYVMQLVQYQRCQSLYGKIIFIIIFLLNVYKPIALIYVCMMIFLHRVVVGSCKNRSTLTFGSHFRQYRRSIHSTVQQINISASNHENRLFLTMTKSLRLHSHICFESVYWFERMLLCLEFFDFIRFACFAVFCFVFSIFNYSSLIWRSHIFVLIINYLYVVVA